MAEPPKLDWDHIKLGPNPDLEDQSSSGISVLPGQNTSSMESGIPRNLPGGTGIPGWILLIEDWICPALI